MHAPIHVVPQKQKLPRRDVHPQFPHVIGEEVEVLTGPRERQCEGAGQVKQLRCAFYEVLPQNLRFLGHLWDVLTFQDAEKPSTDVNRPDAELINPDTHDNDRMATA